MLFTQEIKRSIVDFLFFIKGLFMSLRNPLILDMARNLFQIIFETRALISLRFFL